MSPVPEIISLPVERSRVNETSSPQLPETVPVSDSVVSSVAAISG